MKRSIHRTICSVIVLALLFNLFPAISLASPELSGSDAEWLALSSMLSEIKGVYTEPVAGEYDSGIFNELGDIKTTWGVPNGPLMGNGELLAAVGGTDQKLKVYLSHTGFWNSNPDGTRDEPLDNGKFNTAYPITFGGLDISVGESDPSSFRLEQDVLNAQVNANLAANIQLKAWVMENENTMVIEVSTTEDQAVPVTISAWVPGDGYFPVPPNTYVPQPLNYPHTAGNDDSMMWITRETAAEQNGKPTDWVVRLAMATKIIGSDSNVEYSSETSDGPDKLRKAYATFSVSKDKPVKIVSVMRGGKDNTTFLEDARSHAQAIDESDISAAYTEKQQFWKDYWLKSYVYLSDKRLRDYYYGSLYILGITNREGKNPAGLWGVNTTDTPAWAGDYHMNFNFEMVYNGVASSNRLELAKPYISVINSFIPYGKAWADKIHLLEGRNIPQGQGGVFIPIGIAPYGGVAGDTSLGQKYNAAFAALQYLRTYYHTYDMQQLKDEIYPYLAQVALFWEHDLEKQPDGKYWVVGSGEEWEEDINFIYDLSFVRKLFSSIIEITEDILATEGGAEYLASQGITAERQEKWLDIDENLTPVLTALHTSIGKYGFKNSAKSDDTIYSSGYYGAYPVYPGENIGIETTGELYDLAYNTVDSMYTIYKDYLDQGTMVRELTEVFTQMARMGYKPDAIYKGLLTVIDKKMGNNLFVDEKSTAGLETVAGLETINSMLMQSNQNVIHVFPAWPRDLDGNASFTRLRAKGAFLVSSSLTNGIIGDIIIESEAGRDCTISNPWPGTKLLIKDHNGNTIAPAKVNDEKYTFSTVAGGVYTITATVNKPELFAGLTPVNFAGTDFIATTVENWNYDYSKEAKTWANAKDSNGSLFVWIPRFSTNGSDIIFSKGTEDITENGYSVPEVFNAGTDKLSGIWYAKFATGNEGDEFVSKPGAALNTSTDAEVRTAAIGAISTRLGDDCSGHVQSEAEQSLLDLFTGIYGEVPAGSGNTEYAGGSQSVETVYGANASLSTTGNAYGIYDTKAGGFRGVFYKKSKANTPVILPGMVPVNYDNEVWVETDVNSWNYDYENLQWANAKTSDGSMWVWIPRYSYRIEENGNPSIRLSKGLLDDTSDGFKTHPAFNFGGEQLTGIWVAKYPASVSEQEITSKGDAPATNVTASQAFTLAYDYLHNTENNINSHLMKNVEWGAVSYITTALGKEPVNADESSTGNAYGIYGLVTENGELVSGHVSIAYGDTVITDNYSELLKSNKRYRDVIKESRSTDPLQFSTMGMAMEELADLPGNVWPDQANPILIRGKQNIHAYQGSDGRQGFQFRPVLVQSGTADIPNPAAVKYENDPLPQDRWDSTAENPKVGNAPVLDDSLFPVNFDSESGLWLVSTYENWDYDYGESNKWANAITPDGSMWVWIPRYSYKIDKDNKTIDIKYSKGLVDYTNDDPSYIRHPAFNFGGKELYGIWVAKFEAGTDENDKPVFKPGIGAYRAVKSGDNITKSAGEFFKWALNFDSSMGMSDKTDSHMIKATEWGAVTYLTYANGTIPSGQGENPGMITGGSSDLSEIWGTNSVQSTTRNLYGVYDMSGGCLEFVAVHADNFAAYPDAGGILAVNDVTRPIIEAESKYKDIIPHKLNAEYITTTGMGLEEILIEDINNNQVLWGDSAGVYFTFKPPFPSEDSPEVFKQMIILRRGGLANTWSGMFTYMRNYGYSSYDDSSRAVLAITGNQTTSANCLVQFVVDNSVMKTVAAQKGQKVTVSDPAKIDYVFDAWYTMPNGQGTKFDLEKETVTQNITLYAHFTKAPNDPLPADSWDSTAENPKTGNTPVLAEGLYPINYNAAKGVWEVTSVSDWNYDYGTANMWANAQTADGSMWVWIPRFSYKIDSDSKSIDIKYSKGLVDYTNDDPSYIRHPAFNFGGRELYGIWIAKFEAGNEGGNIVFKPSLPSYTEISGSDFFNRVLSLKGTLNLGELADTHMIKNVDWGAISYLAQFMGNNPAAKDNSITGGSNSANIVFTNNTGQSITNNPYGIYDVGGTPFEVVAAHPELNEAQIAAVPQYFKAIVEAEDKYKDVLGMEFGDGSTVGMAVEEITNAETYSADVKYTWDGGWATYHLPSTIGELPALRRSGLYHYSTTYGAAMADHTSRAVITITGNNNEIPYSLVKYFVDGEEIDRKLVRNGTTTISKVATKRGYVFEGWYTGENGTGMRFDGSTLINGDINVYANWIPVDYQPLPADSWADTAENPYTGNAPVLTEGLYPVNYNADLVSWEVTSVSEWVYDYGTANIWANAQTADGSMWVWIPRFSYKIDSNSKSIDVKYSKGLVDYTNDDPSYVRHPAFNFGGRELYGIWIAKFEAGNEGGNIAFKPSLPSYTMISGTDFFNRALSLKETLNLGELADTHMIKNVDWGAISYLAQFMGNNPAAKDNSITGGSDSASIVFTNNTGQSITNNVYGIYDIGGTPFEVVAAHPELNEAQIAAVPQYFKAIVEAEDKYKDVLSLVFGDGSTVGMAVEEITNAETYSADVKYTWDGGWATYHLPSTIGELPALRRFGLYHYSTTYGAAMDGHTSRAVITVFRNNYSLVRYLVDGVETERRLVENGTTTVSNIPHKAGYEFAGWYTGENGTGTLFDENTIVNGDITVYAYFISTGASTYTITATAGEGGSISPSGATTVEEGGSQLYTITANEGYQIASVMVDGISVGAVSSYEFTNVVSDHTISATFVPVETPEKPTYTITATAGEGGSISPSGATTVEEGGSQLYTITANEGYQIASVMVDGISVGVVNSYEFTNVVRDHTISASFTLLRNDTGSSGGTAPQPVTNGETVTGSTITTQATISDNTATISVTSESIGKAIQSAGSNGNIKLIVDSENVESAVVMLPGPAVDEMARNGNSLSISAANVEITFDSEAIKAIGGMGNGNVSIYVTPVDSGSLPSSVNEIVGNRPVYDLTIQNGNNQVDDFGGGFATISVPYVLKDGEDKNNIVILYVSNDGVVYLVANCNYDPESKKVQFKTSHFSTYAVGYNNIEFDDVASSAWYKDAIRFVSARGLFGGVGNNKFAPSGTMTRAMFTTVLARLENANLDSYTVSEFKDVDIDAWYGKSIAWAADKGIIGGYGNGMFGPNDAITREQMAVILSNYIKYKGIGLIKADNSMSFEDSNNISSWAQSAVDDMRAYGLISGVGGNIFNPKGNADRASVATIFMNLIKACLK